MRNCWIVCSHVRAPLLRSPGGRPAPRFPAGSANLSRIWWNQPRPVELFGLSTEQRKAMDALLLNHLGHRRELAKDSFEIRRTLGDHLAAGDWKAAEKASAELGERASALAKSDTDLTLAVVRLLSTEQRRGPLIGPRGRFLSPRVVEVVDGGIPRVVTWLISVNVRWIGSFLLRLRKVKNSSVQCFPGTDDG